MDTIELTVDGMTCGSCVSAVRRALGAVRGVQSVDVQLETGKATVQGNQVAAQVNALLAALASAGFSAREADAAHAQSAPSSCGSQAPSGRSCCCGQ